MKTKKTLNCKEAKFTQELSIYNNGCINNTFEYSLRRASTTKKFFDLLDEQLSNQLLYNTEEKEAYFLNSDRQLFKLKFEPIDIKNKPDILKEEEIQKLAIPWSSWNEGKYFLYDVFNRLLTDMFIGLLDLIKEREIKIRCGVGMMELFCGYRRYNSYENVITIANCRIIPELDFNVGKHDLVYEGIVLIGESIVEREDETQRILIQHLEDILERGDETELLSIQRALNMTEKKSKSKKKFLGLF
jgi:hypothetical protein